MDREEAAVGDGNQRKPEDIPLGSGYAVEELKYHTLYQIHEVIPEKRGFFNGFIKVRMVE